MAQEFTTARVEAFSYGVIAVIITIMVLELKVPVADGWAGMNAIAHTLGVYVISYAFVGIYWINHHLLLHRVTRSTSSILRANLVWLFFLSLLPFFTANVLEKRENTVSVALYSGSMLITGLTFMLLRVAIGAQQHKEGSVDPRDAAMQRKHWLSLGIYLVGIPLAFFYPILVLCAIGLVTLLWIVPTFGADHSSALAAHSKASR